MPRPPIRTWFFALVVVKQGRRFLLVRESRKNNDWYLPAGRVEPGETFFDAAKRETLEEGGIPIDLEGVLRVEHTPMEDGSARVRVIFLARSADDSPPKQTPDDESLEARWVTYEELVELPLRGDEVRRIIGDVLAGAPVFPLNILGTES